MKTFTVFYNGNASRFKNIACEVNAETERDAVESVYQSYLDTNYFPQEDGSIKDCDGDTIAEADDNTIEYDGGCFYAEWSWVPEKSQAINGRKSLPFLIKNQ